MDTPVETDVCQQRCLHPEHALAVRQHQLAAEAARSVADLFAVLSDPTRIQVVFALLHAPETTVGKKVRCPKCDQKIRVPSPTKDDTKHGIRVEDVKQHIRKATGESAGSATGCGR